MKKFTALSLVFLLTVLAVQTANSQSRPRRVNAAPPTEQQPRQSPSQSSSQQQTDSSEATRPTRPPVLGGATRDSNEQKPTAPQKDAGPEEVGEGDVVKVETTLISIPVSVMDR